jgi:alpha-L-rhamnosidase
VAAVTEGGNPALNAAGATFLRMDGDAAVFEVGAGSYEFQSTMSGGPNGK